MASIRDITREYAEALLELTFNSKAIINALTKIAGENMMAAPFIAEVISRRIKSSPASQKLPPLYLMDSIIKNIGSEYTKEFSSRIGDIFENTFFHSPSEQRPALVKLMKTWYRVLPERVMEDLERIVLVIERESQPARSSSRWPEEPRDGPRGSQVPAPGPRGFRDSEIPVDRRTEPRGADRRADPRADPRLDRQFDRRMDSLADPRMVPRAGARIEPRAEPMRAPHMEPRAEALPPPQPAVRPGRDLRLAEEDELCRRVAVVVHALVKVLDLPAQVPHGSVDQLVLISNMLRLHDIRLKAEHPRIFDAAVDVLSWDKELAVTPDHTQSRYRPLPSQDIFHIARMTETKRPLPRPSPHEPSKKLKLDPWSLEGLAEVSEDKIAFVLASEGEQCSVCAKRLKPGEKMDDHRDMHFRKARGQVLSQSRPWYAPIKEWESGQNIDVVEEGKARFQIPSESAKKSENGRKKMGVKVRDNTKNQDVCALSGEKLKRVFDEDEDEWVYEGTVWMDGPGSEIVLKEVLDARG
uniref:CID domain-containing protein n=2 Tax=Palpitomonas bilix TaxID=652834 RepID=A0A7S3G0E5_9EUKA|mmetsp:Transcript_15142/g.38257  ORF Transcript_15142/g.38257 Transcript_15142/m.38257 type:complete len:526 (+) Transcript_15142:351-1928(+)|eukprot:CAMPEP_0113908422 /NCGR_PEP_ID=MMETSP0780_2-20120614/26148_1 /TAXON_ID=652834 /ORGANISM="Palpitomonas bilix" /LENGTH=525 /DNA_ID=CAMNT_0000903839 /DNA_START=155 /DNA_END=1732 /DNA_ORIENTATION=+ /assembly_acc=CAM_ASM_000599